MRSSAVAHKKRRSRHDNILHNVKSMIRIIHWKMAYWQSPSPPRLSDSLNDHFSWEKKGKKSKRCTFECIFLLLYRCYGGAAFRELIKNANNLRLTAAATQKNLKARRRERGRGGRRFHSQQSAWGRERERRKGGVDKRQETEVEIKHQTNEREKEEEWNRLYRTVGIARL